VALDKVGDMRLADGAHPAARAAFEEALAIRVALADRAPDDTDGLRGIAVSHGKIGDVLLAGGDTAGATVAFTKLLDATRRLAAREPDNVRWQTDLVVGYAKVQSVTGDVEARRALLTDGLAILARLDGEGRLTADQRDWIPWLEGELAGIAASTPGE
jgi:hypothetical protein